MSARIEPQAVVQMVEDYVTSELASREKFDNRDPLDHSGVWSLHALAAAIYVKGYEDGEQAQAERDRGQRARDRQAGDPS